MNVITAYNILCDFSISAFLTAPTNEITPIILIENPITVRITNCSFQDSVGFPAVSLFLLIKSRQPVTK